MEEVSRSEELARRAAELAARAEELAKHARDAGDVDEELQKLEAELTALDEEQERLDRELGDYVHPPEESEPIRDPEEGFTFRLGNLGERIADIVNIALGSVKLGAADVVEHDIVIGDDPLPLQVESFAGSVHVITGDPGNIHVHAERRGIDEDDLKNITVDVERAEDGIHVTARSENNRRGRHWVQLTITVPVGTPTRLRTRGGAIRVDGTGAATRAHTAGGSIKVNGIVGHADLETAGGSIRSEDQEGPVTAKTLGGSIRIVGHSPAIDATTIGGSIRIDGADGPVVASTKGGSITLTGHLSGLCSLDTAGGSILVTLDDASELEVEAAGSSVRTDFDGLVADSGRISGRIGSGDAGKLSARTVAGSVTVKRV
ncbi:MAG: hypothetical protein V7636_2232 [Actinomycetota bacterium]